MLLIRGQETCKDCWKKNMKSMIRPTQSIMYIAFQVNRFHKSILLIVQYKSVKSFYEDFILKNPKQSDPPHKIMRYCIYYST